jgi:hypothetical protein
VVIVLLSLFTEASVVCGIVPIPLNQPIKLSQEQIIVPKISRTTLASFGPTHKCSLVKAEGWLNLPKMGFLNLARWSLWFALRAASHIPQSMWCTDGDTACYKQGPRVASIRWWENSLAMLFKPHIVQFIIRAPQKTFYILQGTHYQSSQYWWFSHNVFIRCTLKKLISHRQVLTILFFFFFLARLGLNSGPHAC